MPSTVMRLAITGFATIAAHPVADSDLRSGMPAYGPHLAHPVQNRVIINDRRLVCISCAAHCRMTEYVVDALTADLAASFGHVEADFAYHGQATTTGASPQRDATHAHMGRLVACDDRGSVPEDWGTSSAHFAVDERLGLAPPSSTTQPAAAPALPSLPTIPAMATGTTATGARASLVFGAVSVLVSRAMHLPLTLSTDGTGSSPAVQSPPTTRAVVSWEGAAQQVCAPHSTTMHGVVSQA